MNEISPVRESVGVEFTEAAAHRVLTLMQEEGRTDLKLRVYVSGGGCSGFQYGFAFEEGAQEDDLQVARSGVVLLIDPLSLQYLRGAEIDYTDDAEGEQFVIRNPNAQTTCGCGSSFTV
jgi:iron-sulfur cluster insertion protein